MRIALLVTGLLAIAAHAQAQTPAPAPAPAANAGARDAAVTNVGEGIAAAFNQRDAAALGSLIDLQALALRTADFLGLGAADKKDFAGGFSRGSKNLVPSLIQVVESNQGVAKFMRVTDHKPGRALVRLELGSSGFDYLEFLVDPKSKEPRAVDWFRLSAGELTSVTFGGVAQMYTTQDPGMLGRLFGTQTVGKAAVEKLQQVGQLQRQEKFAEALAVLQELPEPIASTRMMLTVQAVTARQAQRDDEYTRILGKLAEKYASDPSAAFILLDHYLTRKDLAGSMKALDAVERRVGVDGVTLQIRAAGHLICGDSASALKFAEQSIQREPDRMGGYDLRGSVLVALGRFEDAVAQYQDLEQRFGLQFTRAVFADPQFARFSESKPFKAWLKQ